MALQRETHRTDKFQGLRAMYGDSRLSHAHVEIPYWTNPLPMVVPRQCGMTTWAQGHVATCFGGYPHSNEEFFELWICKGAAESRDAIDSASEQGV